VVVIDKGEILFNGELKELTSQFAKEKLISLYLSKQADIKKFEQMGKIKKLEFPQVVLSVPRETTAVASAEILQHFPIADLTIEEEPIESIIRRVFKGEKISNPKGK
jgi:ABC-2 type transport system ATP-binding protein